MSTRLCGPFPSVELVQAFDACMREQEPTALSLGNLL